MPDTLALHKTLRDTVSSHPLTHSLTLSITVFISSARSLFLLSSLSHDERLFHSVTMPSHPRRGSWYVRESNTGSTSESKVTGALQRDDVLQMYARGDLSNGQLVWTSEKIFPNPQKPRSNRLIRIHDWQRWDQLPDPTRRQLEAEAQPYVDAYTQQRLAQQSNCHGYTIPPPLPARTHELPVYTPPPTRQGNHRVIPPESHRIAMHDSAPVKNSFTGPYTRPSNPCPPMSPLSVYSDGSTYSCSSQNTFGLGSPAPPPSSPYAPSSSGIYPPQDGPY